MKEEFERETEWKVTAFFLALLVVALFALSMFDLLPNSNFRIFKHNSTVSLVLPQGLNSLSQNSHDMKLTAYTLKEGGWEYAFARQNSLWSGWLPRSIGRLGEINYLFKSLKKMSWTPCEAGREPLKCVSQITTPQKLKNDFPKPTLCGQIAFVSQDPIPWLWASGGKAAAASRPSKVLMVEIKCFEG